MRLARDKTSHSHERQVVAFGQSFNTRAQGDATALIYKINGCAYQLVFVGMRIVSKRATVDVVPVSHTFNVRDTAHVSSFPVTSKNHRRRDGRPPGGWNARKITIKRPHRKIRACAATRDGIGVAGARITRETLYYSQTKAPDLTADLRVLVKTLEGRRQRNWKTSPKLR